jgi:hypothetical protein
MTDNIFYAIAWMIYNPILVLLILPVYIVPMFVASWRNHKQRKAIAVLTIFGGWTYVGWVVALAWAVMD